METNAKDTAEILEGMKERTHLFAKELEVLIADIVLEGVILATSDIDDENGGAILEKKVTEVVNKILNTGAFITLEVIKAKGYTITRKDKKE